MIPSQRSDQRNRNFFSPPAASSIQLVLKSGVPWNQPLGEGRETKSAWGYLYVCRQWQGEHMCVTKMTTHKNHMPCHRTMKGRLCMCPLTQQILSPSCTHRHSLCPALSVAGMWQHAYGYLRVLLLLLVYWSIGYPRFMQTEVQLSVGAWQVDMCLCIWMWDFAASPTFPSPFP